MTATNTVDPGGAVGRRAAAAAQRPSTHSQRRVRQAWLFLAPMLIVLALVAGWPLLRTIDFSFTDANLNTMGDANYVGFANYLAYGPPLDAFDPETGEYYLYDAVNDRNFVLQAETGRLIDETDFDNLIVYELRDGVYVNVDTGEDAPGIADPLFTWSGVLADALWWRSVLNTLIFTVTSVTLEVILGVGIALALNAGFRARGLLRAAVLIPWAIPTVVSAKMWGWMYHDSFGVINEILLGLGLISAGLAWTADPELAMMAVVFVDVWKTTPFMALLVLAALQMLPSECYEAAKIDGVHPVKVFFKVTLPLIKPALMVAIIFRSLDALRIFDLIYVLTANTEATMTMSVYARQQLIDFQNVGVGSAASTVLFFIIALITVLYLMAGRVRLGSE